MSMPFFGKLVTSATKPSPPQSPVPGPSSSRRSSWSEPPKVSPIKSSCSKSTEEEVNLVNLMKKFDDLPAIDGFTKNFIVVFYDEKAVQDESDDEGPPRRPVVYLNDPKRNYVLSFGKEICRYLLDNCVDNVHVVSTIGQEELINGLTDNGPVDDVPCSTSDSDEEYEDEKESGSEVGDEEEASVPWQNCKVNVSDMREFFHGNKLVNLAGECGIELDLDHRIGPEPYEEQAFEASVSEEDAEVCLKPDVSVTVVILEEGYVPFIQKKMHEIVYGAVRTSRKGVIIIADSILTSEIPHVRVPEWYQFLNHIEQNQLWGSSMELKCKKHNLCIEVSSANDLCKASPNGGCNLPCGYMECGHVCLQICHPQDINHTTEVFRCKEPCSVKCSHGHGLQKICSDPIQRCLAPLLISGCSHIPEKRVVRCFQEGIARCNRKVYRTLDCDHKAEMKCWEDPSLRVCNEIVVYELSCGHTFELECSEEIPDDLECLVPLDVELDCGHTVHTNCDRITNDGIPTQCGIPCSKRLPCGHLCERSCHPAEECSKCMKICNRQCSRHAHKCGDTASETPHYCSELCGPCNKPFQYQLTCGHEITIKCSDEDPDEQSYVCNEVCGKVLLPCHHLCEKPCWEECGPCEFKLMRKVATCPRGHSQMTTCYELEPPLCQASEVITAMCGHRVTLLCYEVEKLSEQEKMERCKAKCPEEFVGVGDCGHKCPGNCGDCYQSRFHLRCAEPCGKNLICGHPCSFPCNLECPPCKEDCVQFCEHTRCKLDCGVPCVWTCEEPCQYKCVHSRCTKKCSEVCDKALCKEPCPKLLPCGHPCVGICGEKCPPHCRICDPKSLLLGDFSGKSEIDENDRFIYLEDCKHCIEIENFEQWLRTKASSEEILPIHCPICRTRIRWIRRYSKEMRENMEMINEVRLKLFGTPEEIRNQCRAIRRLLFSIDTDGITELVTFHGNIRRELEMLGKGRRYSANVCNGKFLIWLCDNFKEICRLVVKAYKVLDLPSAQQYELGWVEFLNLFSTRYWPLHPNEMKDLFAERNRMIDATALYFRHSNQMPAQTLMILASDVGKKKTWEMKDILWTFRPYSVYRHELFQQKLKALDKFTKTTLAISEMERREIVNAFGGTSGRWFKCDQGHIYIITECGGAEETSTCPECGSEIGGKHHKLLETNYFAPEMDGATEPLYPHMV